MKTGGYRRYLVVVLAIIMGLSYIDRWGLSVAVQSIKADLHLSDTQIGALTGIVFAIFYSAFGIPIGRWADRSDRVFVMAVCMALWTAAVMLCGLVTSFAGLAAARVLAAVGEAGSSPPAYSLMSDYFSREERPAALGVYSLGLPLSMLLGYFLSGYLTQALGWRLMFVALGSPGLVMVPIVYLTLREPRRSYQVSGGAKQHPRRPSRASGAGGEGILSRGVLGDMIQLWRIGTFRYLLLAFCVLHLFGLGIQLWLPAFFIRSYHLSATYIGEWLAIVIGGGYGAGNYVGGWLAKKLASNNERLQLIALAFAVSIGGLVQILVYASHSYRIGFGVILAAMVCVALGDGPLFAALQTAVPPRMRAVSISIIFFFSNLIGMSLGPLAVGALSDALRGVFGEQSLRYALLSMCPGYLFGGCFYWMASRAVSSDILAQSELVSVNNSAHVRASAEV